MHKAAVISRIKRCLCSQTWNRQYPKNGGQAEREKGQLDGLCEDSLLCIKIHLQDDMYHFISFRLNFPDFSGTLFTVVPVPERPSRGFFATLLNLGPLDLDRERLCKYSIV